MDLDRKHRPSSLEEYKGNQKIVDDHLTYLKTGGGPNRIYIGPAGCGKNTLEYLWTKLYLGREITIDTEDGDQDYIEINTSKNRGIEMVRSLADFASTPSQTYVDGVRRKRKIFLNEFEELTPEAKAALKSDMEKYADNCIYTLATNYEDSIKEDALISRCAIFRFKKPKMEEMIEWLDYICEAEEINIPTRQMKIDIITHYDRDFRKILIDGLEALRGKKDPITKDDLYKIYEYDTKGYAREVFEAENHKHKWVSLWKENYFDMRKFLEDYFLLENTHPKLFAKIDSRLRRGCNPMIQMSALFGVLYNE